MKFECTEEEFRIFERLVEQEDFIGSFPFYLELVLLGLKPGTSPATKKELEMFREELEKMGLHIKRVKLEFVDLQELPDYMKQEEYDRPYFVARQPGHLNTLEDTYSEGEKQDYRRDFGLFMGYPDEDVKWFVEEGEDQYEKSKDALNDPDDFDRVTSAVAYTPKPTEKCYRRARARAEKYTDAIRQADKKFDSKIGEKLIDLQLNR